MAVVMIWVMIAPVAKTKTETHRRRIKIRRAINPRGVIRRWGIIDRRRCIVSPSSRRIVCRTTEWPGIISIASITSISITSITTIAATSVGNLNSGSEQCQNRKDA